MQLLFNFILSLGISLTAILLVVNLKKTGHKRSFYLSLIFVVLLFVNVYSYSEQNGLIFLSYLTFIIADAIGFILGPSIYFYVKSIYGDLPRQRKYFWFHFTPLIVYCLLISWPRLWSQLFGPIEGHLAVYLNFIEQYQVFLQIQAVYWIFYAVLSLRLLKQYKLKVQQNYSNLRHKDVVWLKQILQAILFFMSAHLIIELFTWQFELDFFSNGILTSLLLVLIIAYIGYHGIEQNQVPLNLLESNTKPISQHHLYHADKVTIKHLKDQLYAILETEKPYLEEQLSLAELAQMLSISDKKLSALLNHYIGESFYDLINRHRVEYAKALILNPQYEHYTFLAIGIEAGFSSKSSFNRIFKKVVGQSPSQFKKNHFSSPN